MPHPSSLALSTPFFPFRTDSLISTENADRAQAAPVAPAKKELLSVFKARPWRMRVGPRQWHAHLTASSHWAVEVGPLATVPHALKEQGLEHNQTHATSWPTAPGFRYSPATPDHADHTAHASHMASQTGLAPHFLPLLWPCSGPRGHLSLTSPVGSHGPKSSALGPGHLPKRLSVASGPRASLGTLSHPQVHLLPHRAAGQLRAQSENHS